MSDPAGTLTGAQKEILEVVWSAEADGVTASQIWDALSKKRPVARTTVLTLVARLERRGWLARRESPGGLRYAATRGRAQAKSGIARKFANEFFGGSASDLVMSLLGSRKIKPAEIENLRKLLGEADPSKAAKREKGKHSDGSNR